MRLAQTTDLEAIVEIYNQAVRAQFETADTEEVDITERLQWFRDHTPNTYPIFVYEQNQQVSAWVSLSPYRQGRKALQFTAEISYYVHNKYKRQGIGSKLIQHAIQEARTLQFKNLFAIILDKNKLSIHVLSKLGFQQWGHLPGIADFDGVECGHVYYGLKL
ncbi:MAG: N-acetyltransferase [Marinilabiliaceae bacterium]|nr:N-acetyltransferase [Marinilabiliaceae bacterium]